MKRLVALTKTLFLLMIFSLSAEEQAKPSWHQYDSKNRIEKWTLTKEKEIEWVYDFAGNRIEWKDWSGTTRFSYDFCNHLEEVLSPNGQKTSYKHDPGGNLLKISYPSGNEVNYTYGCGAVLDAIVLQKGEITYSYDYQRNLLLKKKLPNGITTEYRYDQARRISHIIHTNAKNALIAHFHFEYDEMDNRILTKKTTLRGEKTVRYIYDRLYRLKEVYSSDGSFEKYTYDSVGDRQTKETPKGLIRYEYDENARLRKAGSVTYDYDDRGNLIKKSSSNGTSIYSYNELGQLVGYEDDDHTIEFTYNGQGERLSKTVDGQTIQYSYEDVLPVFQLLEEKKGKRIKQYLYGHHCLGYLEDKKTYYYLEETPGNPVGIVIDEQGNIVEELEYDVFGKCLSSSNLSVQYNGEQVDNETGLIFLRTRYYDPEIGRFISPDQAPPNLRNPQSLNRYAYVNNNPLNFIDPMGTVPEPKKNTIEPVSWAKGVPIWQEGDPTPSEGMTLVSICARKRGILVHDSSRKEIFRPLDETEGHAWLEFVESNGKQTSISTHREVLTRDVAWNDITNYKLDRDTIRLGYLVPNAVAQQMKDSAENFATKGYNLISHNCVHTTCEGAKIAGIDEFFYTLAPTFAEDGPVFAYNNKLTPSSLYSDLESKIDAMRGWDHPFITPPPELKNEIIWMHLSSDDPYMPSLFPSAESLKLQSQYFQSSPAPLPQRGNFGGISLSKRAEMKIDLKEIYGAVFDEKTQQVILIGKKSIHLPEMRFDDLAVAIQSIYGLKGHSSQDPGISIEPALDRDEMIVRYLGATFGTEFGKVLFDGDYALKMIFLGQYPCHVPGFLSIKERRRLYEQMAPQFFSMRTWIVPERISLAQSTDGSSMLFETVKMRCLSEDMADGQIIKFPPHEAFAQHFTDNYDAIAAEYPIFTEVKRLGQITGVVKWLKDSNIPFDLSFFESYGPNPCSTPLSVPMFKEEFNHVSGTTLNIQGGIDLILNSQNFTVRQESGINSLKEDVVTSRPSEKTFSWELEDSNRNSLSAEALALFKTRKTGDFRKTFTDLQFPVPGEFPLVLSRFYDSFNEQDVGLGVGWSITPFELMLTPKLSFQVNDISFLGHLILVTREGNQQWIYRFQNYNFDDQKVWYAREDNQQVICEHLDHTFSLHLKDGGIANFSEKGQLIALMDRDHIRTEYAYFEEKLAAIRHQNGKMIELVYLEDRLVGIIGPNKAHIVYGYDNKKQLAEVSNSQGRLYQTYHYDEDLRLTHIIDPTGRILFEGGYDEYNRLSSIKIGEKELKKNYNLAEHSSTLISEEGYAIEGRYDQNYCLIGHKAGDRDQWGTFFQENKAVETIFDQEGQKGWEYTRDLQGLLTEAVDPLGNTWRFFYDKNGKLLIKEDPNGENTCFQYDSRGRLALKLEHAQNVKYDEVNKVISNANCSKEYRTRYIYNQDMGRLRTLAIGYDNTHFHYEENGLLEEIEFPSGYTLKRNFDEKLRLKELLDRGGVLKKFEYNEEDLIKVVRSPAGQMEYEYKRGKISKVIDRCGNVTEFEYDDRGDLNTVKDAEGFITRYGYGT